MAEIFAIMEYFNQYFNEYCKFTAKLNTRYKAEIKPKIVKKEKLADLKANEILIQTVNQKELYAAMVRMNQKCDISKYSVVRSKQRVPW